MSLEVVYGESRERGLAQSLADRLAQTTMSGTVYLGYPVLATVDIRVHVDALLVSPDHGLVAFQLSMSEPHTAEHWAAVVAEQDTLYNALESHLGRHDSLRRGRRFAVAIETVTVFPSSVEPPDSAEGHYCSIEEVTGVVSAFEPLDSELYVRLEAALQRVSTIKPAKRRSNVESEGSRGAVLKEIEKGIANLDFWQKQAAIETPDGPQRIRGLAGSGKTIVLALKAAYLHAQKPDWNIAVTFQSRSLYQQFEDLITRFTFEHSNDQPDFARLQILHAWGSSSRQGLYRLAAEHVGHPPRDWNYGRATFGNDEAFGGVCRELNDYIGDTEPRPLFNAVLIDEAQDLPTEFFRLVYSLTADPKRVAFAYDELQNLSEAAMPVAEELFGRSNDGKPLVSFDNKPDEARRDVVLPVCYRNSPWALTIAHAIGFGIYSPDGLVQHFDGTRLWKDIGYAVADGTLSEGHHVSLRRSARSTPKYFESLLDERDAVAFERFDSSAAQDAWLAESIALNLTVDELEPDDIFIVLPNTYTARSRSTDIARRLRAHGIDSHLAGVGSSVDEVFVNGSVAMAHIHRAKGNEAPMVYVVDAQYGVRQAGSVSHRNAIFTAITRSRAWVRLSGYGPRAALLGDEIDLVRNHGYRLEFTVPTEEDLQTMRRIHRDRPDDLADPDQALRTLDEMLELVDSGELDLHALPRSLRARLLRLLRADEE